MQNPKDSTKKLLKIIKEFSKVEGYKMNTQKLLACLYINNEPSNKEIKKTIAFKITSKIIKYLEIDLIKEVNDLSTEKYKTLMKEILKNINK